MDDTAAALTPEVEAAHRELAALDVEFRRRALADPGLLRRANFPDHEAEGSVVNFPIQPWPTFLGAGARRELERVATGLCALVKAVPERLLGNDPVRIAETFGLGDPRRLALVLEPPTGITEGLARGDFLWTPDGLQCLEFNVSAAIGGWETGAIAAGLVATPELAAALDDLGVEPRWVDTLVETFRHVASTALASGVAGDGGALDLAVGYTGAFDSYRRPRMVGLLQQRWADVVEELAPGLAARAYFWDYSGVGSDGRGGLARDGERVHALMELHDNTHPLAFRAFKAGRLALFNGPSSRVLGDKRVLALLSEAADQGRLDGDDGELVRGHVPWTRTVAPVVTGPDGEELALEEFARAERADLVLKKAQSLGAMDVLMGDATPEGGWSRALETALAGGDWVVQRRVRSRPYLFQAGDEGAAACDVVWGPFILGGRYGGTVLRVQPRDLGRAVTLGGAASAGVIFEV